MMMPGERAPAYLNRAMEIKSKLQRAGAQQEDSAFALQVLRGLADDWQEINKVFRYQQGTLTSQMCSRAVAQEQRQRDYIEERKNRLRQAAVCPVGQRESTEKDREGPQEGQGTDPPVLVLQGSRTPSAPVPKRPKDWMASQLDKDQAREIAMKMLGIKKGPLADEYAKRKAQPSGPTKTMKAKALLAQDNQDLLEDESDEEEGGYVPIPPKERAMMAIAHTPRMEMCALSRTKGVWYMDEWLHHTHVLPGRAL